MPGLGRGSVGGEPDTEPAPAPKAKGKAKAKGGGAGKGKGKPGHTFPGGVSHAAVVNAAQELAAETGGPGAYPGWALGASWIGGLGGPCPPTPSSTGRQYYHFHAHEGQPDNFVCIGQNVALRYCGGSWLGHRCGPIKGFDSLEEAVNWSAWYSESGQISVRWQKRLVFRE